MAIIDWQGKVSFVGAVLDTGEMNGYNDSDFYAVVWDEERQTIHRVEYDSTRYAGGGSAVIDATDEVKEKASAYVYKELLELWNRKNEETSKIPIKGNRVRVVSGRKVKIGTEGILFWLDFPRRHSPSHWAPTSQKVGIALSEEKDETGKYINVVWTYISNLEVIDPSVNLKPAENGKHFAERNKYNWRGFTAQGYPVI